MQIEEARRQQSQLSSAIGDGLDQLNLDEVHEFREYSRIVLPLDGYVFWQPKGLIKVPGALHHMQEMLQHEDETVGLATVTFTSRQYTAEFSESPVNTIYVAHRGDFRYAFSRQQGYFRQADFWHYQGQSVYPALASQLLDNPGSIDPTQAIVSNSLPIWLAFNGYESPYLGGFSNPLTLYPSKAVPANLEPPYGSVHIEPGWTRSLQSVPLIQRVVDSQGNVSRVMSQLMADRVRIVLYGLQNEAALEFYGAVLEYIGAQGPMGLMNMPAMTDGKREQVELQALAMQKMIEFEVSYQQLYAKAVAMQLIKSATVTVTPTF